MKNKIIDFHNNLSDKPYIWFPFLFLKPKSEELITQGRILVMALCFGFYSGAILSLRYFWLGNFSVQQAMTSTSYAIIVFFVWFQLVTSRLWNIRAVELQAKKDSHE